MKELLTTKETCLFLKISRLTLFRYIKAKGLPAFKLGRAWKFERTALEEWLKTRMQANHKAIKPVSNKAS